MNGIVTCTVAAVAAVLAELQLAKEKSEKKKKQRKRPTKNDGNVFNSSDDEVKSCHRVCQVESPKHEKVNFRLPINQTHVHK